MISLLFWQHKPSVRTNSVALPLRLNLSKLLLLCLWCPSIEFIKQMIIHLSFLLIIVVTVVSFLPIDIIMLAMNVHLTDP